MQWKGGLIGLGIDNQGSLFMMWELLMAISAVGKGLRVFVLVNII